MEVRPNGVSPEDPIMCSELRLRMAAVVGPGGLNRLDESGVRIPLEMPLLNGDSGPKRDKPSNSTSG